MAGGDPRRPDGRRFQHEVIGLIGAVAFSPYHYEFHSVSGGEGTHKPPPLPPVRLSESLTLRLNSFQDETPNRVCIMWNGKRLWLPKSEVEIERDGEYILLTVPAKLLNEE